MGRCFVVVFLCVLSTEIVAEKAYRWVGEDGSVMYSTTPPDNSDYEEIVLPEPSNLIQQDRASRLRMLNKSRQMDEQARDRREEKTQLQQKIKDTKKALKQAQLALEEGEAPLEGERQRLKSGGTKLSPAYFDRQESLKQTVTEHEEMLKQLRQQLRALQ